MQHLTFPLRTIAELSGGQKNGEDPEHKGHSVVTHHRTPILNPVSKLKQPTRFNKISANLSRRSSLTSSIVNAGGSSGQSAPKITKSLKKKSTQF